MDEHIMEALGRTRVVVREGKVVEVGTPEVQHCPLFAKIRGIQEFTPEVVRENIEFRIQDFGMCTPDRKLKMRDYLSFGVSEVLGMAVARGMLDAAVLVGEGAGTIVVSDPEMIQGIGGRVSGIMRTSPIEAIIDAIGRDRVLDPSAAKIDQVAGAELAYRLGFKRVAVTLASAQDASKLRERYGQKIALFAVHTSGRTEEEAAALFHNCDIVTACASKAVRGKAPELAVFQVGNKIPIYAASLWGEHLLKMRLEAIKAENITSPEDPPRPLI